MQQNSHHVTSFAWGLAPSSARSQVSLAKLGGCTVLDEVWITRVRRELPGISHGSDRDAMSCSIEAEVDTVPRLLLNEFMVRLAGRLLQFKDPAQSFHTPPVAHVYDAFSSSENPPRFWLAHLTGCFPCPGTPVTRCIRAIALLDASHVERSRVIDIRDAGVVPTEEAANDGLVPSNALQAETVVTE